MKIPQQTQEPITTDVPLGLDEPAPILVWRSGLVPILPAGTYSPRFPVFTSEKGAIRRRDDYLRDGEHYAASEPYRIPLVDVIRIAKAAGRFTSVVVRDEYLRIIEEYPL